MTEEARLTRKYLRGEILKLLKGERGRLYRYEGKCTFCKKYNNDCFLCPIYLNNDRMHCMVWSGGFGEIASDMMSSCPDAIPGALAIYMWLYYL